MTSDPIFQPLRFRALTVENRIFRSNISGRFDHEDGSGSQTRINWETQFAKGGAGAIISSYVPVSLRGRILADYATIHRDDFIPYWQTLGEAVRQHGSRYILQLSHSGRQQDLPGISNQHLRPYSATGRKESLHGFLCQAMSTEQVEEAVRLFAEGARRAKAARLDGVELHAANGYLITQFLSSAINDRSDRYGGSLYNRARFLLDIIQAIRATVGWDFHLQVKISAVDLNNVIPWEGKGNRLAETVEVCKWVEAAGADAIHVSTGSLFPHPLNPPGDFPFETIATTYDAMLSAGLDTFRNYLLFRYRVLRPIFRLIWNRMKKGQPVEGIGLDEARAIKRAVSIPVISTGGWQNAALIRGAIGEGSCDAVSMARPLVANPDLPRWFADGHDLPPKPCSFCNRCLLNAPKNPMGCYDPARFASTEEMIERLHAVYATAPDYRIPE